MKTLRVGLLTNSRSQAGWIGELIQLLRRNNSVELSAVIVAEGVASQHRRRGAMLDGLAKLEARMLKGREREMLRDASPDSITAIHELRLSNGKEGLEADAFDLARLRQDIPIDLLIVVGMGAVRGDLLGYPTHGVWQLSHSDVATVHGSHAGFWEVYQRADHTTVKLWQLGARAEQDHLVDQRSFNTEMFWLKNQVRGLTLGNFVVDDAVSALVAEPRQPRAPLELQVPTGRRRVQPASWDSASYLARQAWLMTEMVWRRATRKNVTWRIGLCPAMRPQAAASDMAVLTAPKGRFFADPFVYNAGGQPYIFFEDYAFAEGRGKISVATRENGEFKFLGTVLDLPYHLSFPYIFDHGGTTYMVPETCGNRTIEIWKCVDFPLKWEKETTLMNDVSAVDTLVFPHEGRWWMLTNIDRADGVSHCDELFAFYSDSPTSEQWTPHAMNPVVRSPSKARNGGLMISPEGVITRCAQYQGFCHYGKGLSQNEIVHLSPERYEEKDGAIHYPGFAGRKRVPSMHHWHHQGGHSVFDFAYME